MVNAELSPRQRQTANGRRAFLERFPDAEARSEHFRGLAQRAAEGRIVLTKQDASVLANAYEILGRIAERSPQVKGGEL